MESLSKHLLLSTDSHGTALFILSLRYIIMSSLKAAALPNIFFSFFIACQQGSEQKTKKWGEQQTVFFEFMVVAL